LAVSAAEFAGLTGAAELRVADATGREVPSQVYDLQGAGGTFTCRLLFQADVGRTPTLRTTSTTRIRPQRRRPTPPTSPAPPPAAW